MNQSAAGIPRPRGLLKLATGLSGNKVAPLSFRHSEPQKRHRSDRSSHQPTRKRGVRGGGETGKGKAAQPRRRSRGQGHTHAHARSLARRPAPAHVRRTAARAADRLVHGRASSTAAADGIPWQSCPSGSASASRHLCHHSDLWRAGDPRLSAPLIPSRNRDSRDHRSHLPPCPALIEQPTAPRA
jgi:hypothetical protein